MNWSRQYFLIENQSQCFWSLTLAGHFPLIRAMWRKDVCLSVSCRNKWEVKSKTAFIFWDSSENYPLVWVFIHAVCVFIHAVCSGSSRYHLDFMNKLYFINTRICKLVTLAKRLNTTCDSSIKTNKKTNKQPRVKWLNKKSYKINAGIVVWGSEDFLCLSLWNAS